MKTYLLFVILSSLLVACTPSRQHTEPNGKPSFKFQKEGQLTLYRSGQAIRTLAIEVADSEAKILRGLMFREHLDADQGMLFVYPAADTRQFWMKNTAIPLDILYFDADKQLLNIAYEATPFALTGIAPSEGPAKYVLEIKSGLSQQWGLVPKQTHFEFMRVP